MAGVNEKDAYQFGVAEGYDVGLQATVAHVDFVDELGEDDAIGLESFDDLSGIGPDDALGVLECASYRHRRAKQELPQSEKSIMESDNWSNLLTEYENGIADGIERAIQERLRK